MILHLSPPTPLLTHPPTHLLLHSASAISPCVASTLLWRGLGGGGGGGGRLMRRNPSGFVSDCSSLLLLSPSDGCTRSSVHNGALVSVPATCARTKTNNTCVVFFVCAPRKQNPMVTHVMITDPCAASYPEGGGAAAHLKRQLRPPRERKHFIKRWFDPLTSPVVYETHAHRTDAVL